MKNSFAVIFVLFLASNCTIAQIPLVERTFNHAFNTQMVDFEAYSGGQWIVGTSLEFSDFISYRNSRKSASIMMLNDEAEIEWIKTFQTYELSEVKDIHVLSNGNIAVLTNEQLADDVFDIHWFVYLLDSDGELISSYSYDQPEESETGLGSKDLFLKIVSDSNDELWIVYNYEKTYSWENEISGILYLDLNQENLIPHVDFDAESMDIKDAVMGFDDRILLATHGGIRKLNQSGEIEAQYDSNVPVLKISPNRAITQNHVLQFDVDLNLFQNNDLSSRFDSLVNFNTSDEHLWLLGKKLNSDIFQYEKILLEDVDMNVILTVDVPNEYLFPIGVHPFSDKLFLVGNESVQASQKSFVKTYEQTIGMTLDFEMDISLASLELVNFRESTIESFSGYFFDAYITVKNESSDTVHQIYINYKDNNGFTGTNSIPIPNAVSGTSLQLLPNESRIFGPYQNFTVWGHEMQEEEICFWVTSPNDRIDRDYNNNISCELVVLADIAAPIAASNDIAIFPNPFHQKVEIHTQTNFPKDAQISVFNTLGQVVYQSSLKSNQTQTVLDLAGLQQGVYILEVKSEQEQTRWMERVVKY